MSSLAVAETFEAIPMIASPERADVVSHVMRRLVAHDPMWIDDLEEEGARLAYTSWLLSAPDARFWEVWKDGEEWPVGVVYLTKIEPGHDAQAHYVFFDGRLSGRDRMIQRMIEHWFTDRDGWPALRRVTLEIPVHYHTLAWHAVKRLGFGGPFKYTTEKKKGRAKQLPIEGIRRRGFRKDGRAWDMLILGRLNDAPAENGGFFVPDNEGD